MRFLGRTRLLERHRPGLRSWLLSTGTLAPWLLEPAHLAAQCAMCRTSLTNSVEGQHWARGIDQGILLLIAVPFLVAGSILLWIFRREVAVALHRLGRFLVQAASGQRREFSRTPEFSKPTTDTTR